MHRAKYGNKKVEVDGHRFDSMKEAKRYRELKALQDRGEISNLRMQIPYELVPHQKIDGKVVERSVVYYADFVYDYKGSTVVEDTKGFKTPEYIIKRKLMLKVYGIRINEI